MLQYICVYVRVCERERASVLQCVAVCCSVLQCVAVRCIVSHSPKSAVQPFYIANREASCLFKLIGPSDSSMEILFNLVATISRLLKITGLLCKRAL